MSKAFTLLETLFSLLIMDTAIIGVFSLMQQVAGAEPLSGERLISSYLGQEGIEIVRNIRDVNKLKKLSWDQGLTACASGCQADYLSQTLSPWTGAYLLNSGSFYNYSSGSVSKYQRKITIVVQGLPTDTLKVNVEIFWSEKNRSHSLKIQENLYKW